MKTNQRYVEKLIRSLEKLPSLELSDNVNNTLFIKCTDPASVAVITFCIYTCDTIDNACWILETGLDPDTLCLFYALSFPEKNSKQEIVSFVNYLKENTGFYYWYKNNLENESGIPDMSFVTMGDIVKELKRRKNPFCLTWKDRNKLKTRSNI